MMHWMIAAAAPLSVLAVLPVGAGQSASTEAGATDIIKVTTDRYDRLTVPVRIGDNGPYDFLIDTGSERTVLARGLAERLGLVPSGTATLVGMAGSLAVDLVEVEEVKLGRRSFYDVSAPLLDGHHIGADGIIGLDGLRNQRVLIDFRKNLIAVNDAKVLGGNRGFEIIVTARRKSGQMIITNALVDGIKTDVVIDTGADSSVGNMALMRQLTKRRKSEPTVLYSVTGQRIDAEIMLARRVTIDRLDMIDLPLAFVDAPPFARLGLADKPAMMLGMNQLRAFNRVAIDFPSRKVLFDLPPQDGIRFGTR